MNCDVTTQCLDQLAQGFDWPFPASYVENEKVRFAFLTAD